MRRTPKNRRPLPPATRKLIDQEMHGSEARLRSIFRAAPVGIGLVINRVILEANDLLCRMTGYSKNELIGQSARLLYPSDEDFDFVGKEKYRQIAYRGAGSVETRWRRKDGTVIDVLLSSGALDPSDLSIGVTFTALDITDRRRMESELRSSHEQMRIAQAAANAGLWDWDMLTGRLEWSEQFFELLGLSSAAGPSFDTWLEVVHPEDREPAMKKIQKAIDEHKRLENEYRIVRSDGEERWIAALGDTFYNDTGKPERMIGICIDITERKRAEEALLGAHEELELRVQERTAQLTEAYRSLQLEMEKRERAEDQLRQVHKMEAIGTLAGGIAHDFNNILAAVIGFAEMVEEDLPPDSKSTLRIQRVLKAAYRGRDLVKQILAFSRKTDVARSPLSLSPLLEETAHLLRASLPATIEIRVSMEAASDMVLASPTEIQQVIVNLATNASFAMRENGGILGIDITNLDLDPDSPVLNDDAGPGEYVQLTVTDMGHGMEPHVMKRVFEPFFTTKGVGEGTGMGLAVVYGIVKSLGGSVLAESKPGMGSTFRVYLPVARTDMKSEIGERLAIPRGSEHILFVDDEEFLMEWGKAALEHLGYTVTALDDSTEALNLFSSDPYRFDLVITDQTMPRLTGMGLARKILALRPNIPIILCTGHSDSVSSEKAKEAGIREFLMKPLKTEELARAIRMVLDAGEEQ